jgi:hydroxymethylglutaryl-CoA synthase
LDARKRFELTGEVDEAFEKEWMTKPIEETYTDRGLEGVLKKQSAADFKTRLADSNMASKIIGNTYTASVFIGLASLIDRVGGRGDLTPGKSIAVFSYGSGALATMYRLSV